jgi:hypothetical protein
MIVLCNIANMKKEIYNNFNKFVVQNTINMKWKDNNLHKEIVNIRTAWISHMIRLEIAGHSIGNTADTRIYVILL